MSHTRTMSLQPGIVRHAAEAKPEYRDYWRDLTFCAPFKGRNWHEMSEGGRHVAKVQNMQHTAGLFGSALYREPNCKAFISYQPGTMQYTFVWESAWTLAWSVNYYGTCWLPGSAFTNYFLMGSHVGVRTYTHGSWLVYRPFFSTDLAFGVYTSLPGTEYLRWTLPASALLGQHTYSIRRVYPWAPLMVELHVDGVSYGTRSTIHAVSTWPGFFHNFTIGSHHADPTANPGSQYGHYDVVAAWRRTFNDEEVAAWHHNPLGMFQQRRRRVRPPAAALPSPRPPCDWFDPRTGQPWQAGAEGADWYDAQGGRDWYDGKAASSWQEGKAAGGWYDRRRCS